MVSNIVWGSSREDADLSGPFVMLLTTSVQWLRTSHWAAVSCHPVFALLQHAAWLDNNAHALACLPSQESGCPYLLNGVTFGNATAQENIALTLFAEPAA